MESFCNIQFNLNATISKAHLNFKNSPKERITTSYVETRLESLEANWSVFIETHMKIISNATLQEYERSEYNKTNMYEVTEELYTVYKSELKDLLKRLIERESMLRTSESSTKGTNQGSVKLPKIILPTFSGDYLEWVSFRELFMSLIHKNDLLDDVQKLHYLKTHLSGEAESILRHIPIISDNYAICWSLLEKRYNNKKYVVNCILKRLMSQRNIVTESSSALKELLDTSNECLNYLANLGISTENWDIIVIYILCLKLDNDSRKLWETQISNISDKLPTLVQFQEFLEHRFKSLEFLDYKSQRNIPNSKNTLKSLHLVNVSCPFCHEGHKLANCKKFGSKTIDIRREFVQSNSLCFNCLGANHSMYSCRQSTRCRLCNKKHHTLLHLKYFKGIGSDDVSADQVDQNIAVKATPSSYSNSVKVSTNNFSNNQTQVLLPTASIKAIARNGTAVVLRSLLDQGSQASFVTESAVQKLGLEREPSSGLVSGLGDDHSASTSPKSMVLLKVQSRVDPSFVTTVKAYVLEKLTTVLPEKKVVTEFPALSTLELADPSFNTPQNIDVLLGAAMYGKILLQGLFIGPAGYPIAQETKFGWILSGDIDGGIHHSDTRKNHMMKREKKGPDLMKYLETSYHKKGRKKKYRRCNSRRMMI